MVLVVKRRRKALTAPMLEAAEIAIRERCETRGGQLEEFGAEADHPCAGLIAAGDDAGGVRQRGEDDNIATLAPRLS